MKFCDYNCNFFYRFYNYTLNKFYGIGNSTINYRDLLYAYLNIHWQYLPASAGGSANITTEFVGSIVSNTSVLPTATPALFFENDQAAFDGGVAKNDIYYLSQDNTYGLPFGTPKKLVEDVE